ncbi:MAG TPA: type I-C CRISPR-associated protein Cas8c/Csd1 [Thermoanaerobaculia bacterium]|jgi:CRISPR-associated protein Csd1|nr:type I-C CRISPR-associated protein Cas8c/Csd1 [Thermoanaerobaculia bacterium]
MLESLVRYATSHRLVAEPGFKPKEARWSIQVDPAKGYLGLQELGQAGPKNKGTTFAMCPDLTQPEMKRGGGGTRHFLLDQVDVVARWADEPDAKLAAKHSYFVGLLRQAAEAMPGLAACAAALEDPEQLARLQADLQASKAKPTDKATFALAQPEGGFEFPVVSDAWHGWWRGFRRTLSRDGGADAPSEGGEAAATVRCLASGELVAPVATQFMIRGLADVGGLPTGDALASFKQESFCSYGFVQGENAPVSEEMAAAFRAALEHLLTRNVVRLGDLKVVYWFRDALPPEEDLFEIYGQGQELAPGAERLAARFLRKIETGERGDLANNRFYALTLSGASGRIMVHDWIEGSFEELARAQQGWFEALEIVRRDGTGLARDPKFMAVGGALVRTLDDLPRPLRVALWRSALRSDRPMPQQALAMALARFRLDVLDPDTSLNHARAGVLKACLLRSVATSHGDRNLMTHLNEQHPSAAYHCGRLVALLAELQRRALGDVGAGVVQRYYAAASATPALVLGRLLRTAQFHLDKLEIGLRHILDGQIAQVLAQMGDELPQTLDLPGQALFALGYYQQIAHDRAAAALRRAERNAPTAVVSTARFLHLDDTDPEIAS